MSPTIGKSAAIAGLSVIIFMGQGCSLKWLQSDGGEENGTSTQDRLAAGQPGSKSGGGTTSDGGNMSDRSEWKGQGVNPNFPGMVPGGSQGRELSGFSSNPSEERLTQGSIASKSYSGSGMDVVQRAELTKEEKAAIEAGLQDVFFGYDQWVLTETAMRALNHDAAWLKDHPGAVMKVEGHCDERGTTDYNVVLGDKRAKSARAYLIEVGVSPKQVATVSYGKERPFCMDHDETCYQQNRRDHVLLKVKN
ncbi:MAG TPA: OmpA family protein [Nitrospira sp.]|nr:OmpA family protein [Nitrospira sp.]